MAKKLKILVLILLFGVIIFPEQMAYAQEIKTHENCCCTTGEKHQSDDNDTKDRCGTTCHDCSVSHSNHFPIFYYPSETQENSVTFYEEKKNTPYFSVFLSRISYDIWQPPKIG